MMTLVAEVKLVINNLFPAATKNDKATHMDIFIGEIISLIF